MTKDEEHLNLLGTFHYVLAAIGALFACLPLIHVGMGVLMLVSPETMTGGKSGDAPPAFVGWFMIGVGFFFVLVGWTAAVFTAISGRYLKRREKRLFSFVMAAILCAFMPIGTILGVFTILVLSRESVVRLYEGKASLAHDPGSPTATVPPLPGQPRTL